MTGFGNDAIFRWLGNSAVYSFIALAITLCVAVPAGDALAMTEFRGRPTLLIATLIVMLMPSATLVVPLFLEINAMGLIGLSLALDPHARPGSYRTPPVRRRVQRSAGASSRMRPTRPTHSGDYRLKPAVIPVTS